MENTKLLLMSKLLNQITSTYANAVLTAYNWKSKLQILEGGE